MEQAVPRPWAEALLARVLLLPEALAGPVDSSLETETCSAVRVEIAGPVEAQEGERRGAMVWPRLQIRAAEAEAQERSMVPLNPRAEEEAVLADTST